MDARMDIVWIQCETEKVRKPPKPALLYIVENIPIGVLI